MAGRVVASFREKRRDLPWRKSRDPYAIWVSEVMLQQTRVAAVIPYFERWMKRFPTAGALAAADLDEVLAHWSGLGYYRRARLLHRAAGEVCERFGGALPRSARELETLPGIGRYTAGAIASVAFGERAPIVDGNVGRVLARLYEIEEELGGSRATRELWRLADALCPEEAPGDFNEGLMELGATICTPRSPACDLCPLSDLCRARAAGRAAELPRQPRRRRPEEKPLLETVAAWVTRGDRILLARRPPDGLYGGLWELPQAAGRAALRRAFRGRILLDPGPAAAHYRGELTHRRLVIEVLSGQARGRVAGMSAVGYDRVNWHPLGNLGELGLSSASLAIARQLLEKTRCPRQLKRPNSSRRATGSSSKA